MKLYNNIKISLPGGGTIDLTTQDVINKIKRFLVLSGYIDIDIEELLKELNNEDLISLVDHIIHADGAHSEAYTK